MGGEYAIDMHVFPLNLMTLGYTLLVLLCVYGILEFVRGQQEFEMESIFMEKIGYTRVSSTDQNLDRQV